MDFMNTSDIIILLLPIMGFAALWLFHWIEQKMPPAKRKELDYYTEKAVKCIEQTCAGTSQQKKNAAITMIYAFFKDINRPAPSQILIDAALEACVYEINQMKIPGLRVDTGPIKTVLPPEGGQPA